MTGIFFGHFPCRVGTLLLNPILSLCQGRGEGTHLTATAFEMALWGLSLSFIPDEFVAMVTEHASSK